MARAKMSVLRAVLCSEVLEEFDPILPLVKYLDELEDERGREEIKASPVSFAFTIGDVLSVIVVQGKVILLDEIVGVRGYPLLQNSDEALRLLAELVREG